MAEETDSGQLQGLSRPNPFRFLRGDLLFVSYAIVFMVLFISGSLILMLGQLRPTTNLLLFCGFLAVSLGFISLASFSLKWLPLRPPSLYDLYVDTRVALLSYWYPGADDGETWRYDSSSTPYVDLRSRLIAAIGTSVILTVVLTIGASVLTVGVPPQETLWLIGIIGAGVGQVMITIVILRWSPEDIGSANRDLYDEHAASDSTIKAVLTDPDRRPRPVHFVNPRDIYKAAEWLSDPAVHGSLEPNIYRTKLEQLKQVADEMDASEYVGARHEKPDEIDDMIEDISEDTTGEPIKDVQQRVRTGSHARSDEVKRIAAREAEREYGYSSLDVFRVVNEGAFAFVGAKAKSSPVSSDIVVLEVDLTEPTILSRDTFNASTNSKAMENAQRKLDAVEGVSVDRSSGQTVLDALAETMDDGTSSTNTRRSGSRSSRRGITDRAISGSKSLGDFSGGDWFESPKCPECGSQKVGQETDTTYQCRSCGQIIHTGVDVS